MARHPRFLKEPKSADNAAAVSSDIDEIKQAFARRLFKHMQDRKWNQSDLARAAGLGRDAVSTYLSAKVLPSPRSAKALADALGLGIQELIPEAYARGGGAEPPAAIELRQIASSGRVFLKVQREVSLQLAAKIIELLDSEPISA